MQINMISSFVQIKREHQGNPVHFRLLSGNRSMKLDVNKNGAKKLELFFRVFLARNMYLGNIFFIPDRNSLYPRTKFC